MAKIKHNNPLDTIDEIIQDATNNGILHLNADDREFQGRFISIDSNRLFHFGTTSYLGLGHDLRIKEAAIDAIKRYGTQFPLSKTYISHPLYAQLEAQVQRIYRKPIIITKNSTLGHLAVIPTAVNDNDAVILDHQVHWSVQNASQVLKTRNIPVRMIRHSAMEMLEYHIKALKDKVTNIWYMADGVYSMYGDYTPIEGLKQLCEKYPQLHIYYDDVHGMSWKGPNGGGYILEQYPDLPENIILVGTLSKSFGASGAVVVCPDKKLHRKIKNYGGPLTFSAQLEPASVGAAIAASKIHLSEEIYEMQKQLKMRINYFNELLLNSNIPLIHHNDSPVFFIGTGTPQTGYALVKILMEEGFFVNLGLYPAVPIKNTGLRITISLKNEMEDILNLFLCLQKNYARILSKTNNSLDQVKSAFGLETSKVAASKNSEFDIQISRSILNLDKNEWDEKFSGYGVYDYEGLKMLEKSFSGNPDPEENWDFYYIRITRKGRPVLLSFLTHSLWKTDMLLPEYISRKVEEIRVSDKYYQTSKALSMGCLISEGPHLWMDSSQSGKVFHQFLKVLDQIKADTKADTLVLRDFEPEFKFENEIRKQGYMQFQMPDSCIHFLDWEEDFSRSLSKRNRRHLKNDVLKYTSLVTVKKVEKLTEELLQQAYQLYRNVKEQNLALNTYYYPIRFFQQINSSKAWEFLIATHPDDSNKLIGVMFIYKNNSTSVPALVGLDYGYNEEFSIYRQLLYYTILQAKAEGYRKLDLGFSANFEKQKLGARIFPKLAYIQMDDNYAMEALQAL
ncbi:aminotransferase class I/II-fold pyridoxal phosphate-dependent enzyme [Salegentibacter sp. HM20]